MELREIQRGCRLAGATILLLAFGAQSVRAEGTAKEKTEQASEDKAKDPPMVKAIDKTVASRGDAVRLTFDQEQWPAEMDPKTLRVLLDETEVQILSSPQKGSPSLTFLVPDCVRGPFLHLGVSVVSVRYGSDSIAVLPEASRLEIVPGNGGLTPKITGVYPHASYPVDGFYSLRIQGEGFARHGCDNRISLGGEIQEICWRGDACEKTGIRGHVTAEGLIALEKIAPGDHDFRTLGLRVGTKPESTTAIRLSQVDRNTPLRWALPLGAVAFFGLLGFALGQANRREIGGELYGSSRIFIDAETGTYSLSKFQFFLWTLIAVLGYLFLSISTWLVQGRLEFLEVPDGLPGIVMISAATRITAQLTQNAKGAQRNFDSAPSFGDLVSENGVIAPERFQFLLWSILGAAIFLYITFSHDPGAIESLPKVPPGFLMLMGISSAGYLGGKMLRRPASAIPR